MIPNLRQLLAAVPALTIVALSHAGACPACWPLIGGLVSSLGLTFLVEVRYLLPLMIGCLAIAITALAYGTKRDYRPLFLAVSAVALEHHDRFSRAFVTNRSAHAAAGKGNFHANHALQEWLFHGFRAGREFQPRQVSPTASAIPASRDSKPPLV